MDDNALTLDRWQEAKEANEARVNAPVSDVPPTRAVLLADLAWYAANSQEDPAWRGTGSPWMQGHDEPCPKCYGTEKVQNAQGALIFCPACMGHLYAATDPSLLTKHLHELDPEREKSASERAYDRKMRVEGHLDNCTPDQRRLLHYAFRPPRDLEHVEDLKRLSQYPEAAWMVPEVMEEFKLAGYHDMTNLGAWLAKLGAQTQHPNGKVGKAAFLQLRRLRGYVTAAVDAALAAYGATPPDAGPKSLTENEMAERQGVSRQAVNRQLHSHGIPMRKVGNKAGRAALRDIEVLYPELAERLNGQQASSSAA